METLGLVVLGFILFKAGAVVSIFYILWRMTRSISGIINALRLLNHVTNHAEDFGRMYYLTHAQIALLRNNGHDPDQAGVAVIRPREDHV